MTFVNHGCNGTYNIGLPLNVTEHDAVAGLGPEANGCGEEFSIYSPAVDRLFPDWRCGDTILVLRDIEPGDELLDNYLPFAGTESGNDWEENLSELKRICSENGVGSVTEYEASLSLRDISADAKIDIDS
jgi:hypothetical protein